VHNLPFDAACASKIVRSLDFVGEPTSEKSQPRRPPKDRSKAESNDIDSDSTDAVIVSSLAKIIGELGRLNSQHQTIFNLGDDLPDPKDLYLCTG